MHRIDPFNGVDLFGSLFGINLPCTTKEGFLMTSGNPLTPKRWQRRVRLNKFAVDNVLLVKSLTCIPKLCIDCIGNIPLPSPGC